MQFNWTSNNFFKKIISALGSEWPGATNDNWDAADTELANRHKKNEDVLPDTDNTRSIGSAIKRFLNAHFGQITLGGVTRSTWPSPGSASVGLTDVLANSSQGNIPAGLKAALRSSTGINTWFSVDEATGRVGMGTTSPWAQLEIVPQANIEILRSTTGYSVTGNNSHSMVSLDGMWNTSGEVTLIDVNVTDYASPAGSKLINLKLDGVSRFRVEKNGNVGLGISPSVQLELSTSGAQKQSGTTWSNPSSELLKDIQGPADLQRCYDDTKALQLKRYRVKDDCFTQEAVKDRTVTGLVAEDVQKIIPKAVNVAPFAKVPILDGEEEYEEQEFVVDSVEVQEIELIAGQPILVKKLKDQKRMLADAIQVKDDLGNLVVYTDDKGEQKPLIHSVPRMVKKTRPKKRKEVIEDCLNLDMSQVYMQMLGAVQLLQLKVEALETEIITIKGV